MSGFSFTGFAPPAGESGAEGGAPAPFAGFAAPTIDGSKPAEGGLVFGAAAPAPAAGDDGADGAEEPSAGPGPEEESTAEFTPVVQLDEVEVKTHEEDEDVDFKIRAKLFRFSETLLNKGSGKKEWIERGVGEVKLLKHRENSMVRVLMRQEKTMKIICNHVVDPRIELEPNVGSDRSWVWSAWDFSSGELEDTIFAIRFGNSDGAKEYKEAFEKAKAHMKALKDGADGEANAEADAAADALAGLSAGADKEKP